MMDRDLREAHMSIAASSMFPGFRFCPTDEELISYYLRKKLDGDEDSVQVISELELCTFEPWDLPGKSFIQSNNEWFFFSPRGRKYPNGSQSKRATECGYWKATGKERNVKSGQNVIGTKRTLVFHLGRAPKGERTEWIMHEYCINDKSQDSLVVCRLKRNTEFRATDHSNKASHESDCGVSEGVTVQGGTCVSIQDKELGCSSKRSNSSNSSPSTTGQIDSVTESSHRVANEANHPRQIDSVPESSHRAANEADHPRQIDFAAESSHRVANEADHPRGIDCVPESSHKAANEADHPRQIDFAAESSHRVADHPRPIDFVPESSHRVANEAPESSHRVAKEADHPRQIDSAAESSHRIANEIDHPRQIHRVANEIDQPRQIHRVANEADQRQVYEEDCYAEILNDDIINLDESALSRRPTPPTTTPLPPQGTANRRIRLRVPKSNASTGIRSHCSNQSSNKINTSLPRCFLLFTFFVFTLLALGFFLIGRSQTNAQRFRDRPQV